MKAAKTKRSAVIAWLIFLGFGTVATATAANQIQAPTHGVSTNPAQTTNTEMAAPAVTVQPPSAETASTHQATGGITFTCDPNFATNGPPGLCASLTTVISPLYNNTFTNANASIYILFDPSAGLANSTTGFFNLVNYSTYQAALQSVSTDPAKSTVPATEPSIFRGLQVNVTSALAQALGITTAANGSAILGTTADAQPCTTPGTGGCYNGIIRVITPAALQTNNDQGFTYRALGGSTTGTTDNYDFYSVVEHEVDEVLGTASCNDLTSSGVNNEGCVAAVDLFRYTSTGTRIFDTTGISYFSPDGGLTDTDSNTYNTTKPGEDWADFSQACLFVQDAEACPSGSNPSNSLDITTDGPGGTAGPEIAILNAVGYNLNTTTTKKPQTITFNPLPNVTYGVGPITLTATASSGLPVSYTVTGPATLNGSTLTITGAGTVTVTASQAGDSTYEPATPVVRSFTVAKAVLTVTANNASRPFGAANPTFTYKITGFVNGDTSAVVSGTATETTTATSTSPPGTYPITFSTEALTAANYTFTYVNGTLTVTSNTAANFTIAVIPPAETIHRGDLAGFILKLQSVNGFSGNVTLSCSGGPAGSKCADLPGTVQVNGTAYALSGILFPENTKPGTYVLTITGVSGSLKNTATAKFTVLQ